MTGAVTAWQADNHRPRPHPAAHRIRATGSPVYTTPQVTWGWLLPRQLCQQLPGKTTSPWEEDPTRSSQPRPFQTLTVVQSPHAAGLAPSGVATPIVMLAEDRVTTMSITGPQPLVPLTQTSPTLWALCKPEPRTFFPQGSAAPSLGCSALGLQPAPLLLSHTPHQSNPHIHWSMCTQQSPAPLPLAGHITASSPGPVPAQGLSSDWGLGYHWGVPGGSAFLFQVFSSNRTRP